jgi:hypothetical protein
MCLAFFLKIKPQSRDERKCLELVQGTAAHRWGKTGLEKMAGEGTGQREQNCWSGAIG